MLTMIRKPPKNEYESQCDYHYWDSRTNPFDLTTSTPYTGMSITKRAKELKKGYMTGWPDYIRLDPRVYKERIDNHTMHLHIIPFQGIEFKTEKKTGGVVSKEQHIVLYNMKKRGGLAFVSHNATTTKNRIIKMKNMTTALFKGPIIITGDNIKVTFPKSRKLKMPPRRGFNEEDRKKRERKRKKGKKKKKKKQKKRQSLKSTSKVKYTSKIRKRKRKRK